MIVHKMLIRRGLPVTLVMAVAIMVQPPPASAEGGHFSFSFGYNYPYYGHHRGHYSGYRGYYAPAYSAYRASLYPVRPIYSSRSRSGAINLKVRPKKTDVYVDGALVGTAGRFDGYPGYLWLRDGNYRLTFHLQGYRPFEQVVEVRAGMVTDVRLDMILGPSGEPPSARVRPPVVGGPDRTPAPPQPPAPPAEVPPAVLPSASPLPTSASAAPIAEVSSQGGELKLRVEPSDASIYLDGRFLGTAAQIERLQGGLAVSSGQHSLEVVHPRFATDRTTFRLAPGEAIELRVTLKEASGE